MSSAISKTSMTDAESPVRLLGEPEPVKPLDARVPDNWALHFRILQSLRDRLLEERETEIAGATAPEEQHGMDLADSATDEFDHELALGILSQEQDSLYKVEAAIHRILDGTYGICEETGNPISAVRLLAVPWTRFSKEAQERMEEKAEAAVAHLGRLGTVKPMVRSTRSEQNEKTEEDETDDHATPELLPFRHEKVVHAIERAIVTGPASADEHMVPQTATDEA